MYDDEALDKLLDRTQAGQEEREMAMNEYFSSFKVATYAFKEEEVHVNQHMRSFSIYIMLPKKKMPAESNKAVLRY